MKRVILSVFISAAWLFMFGCYTQTPRPAAYDYSTQQTMQAAYHWDILAEDVAREIKMNLAKRESLTQPVYVEPACGAPLSPCQPHGESPFGEGFRDLLMTHLVKQGLITIDEIENGALVVSNKVQVVYHKENRPTRRYPAGIVSGIATTIAGSILVLRDAYEYGSVGPQSLALGFAVIGGGVWYDVTGGMFNKMPHSEVIITTSIKDYNAYVMRKTDIYYINDQDYWHYMTPPPAHVIEVHGS